MNTIHRLTGRLLIVAFCLKASLAQAAGFGFLDVAADAEGPPLRGAVWSPCAAAPQPIPLGPLLISGSKDCPVAGTRLPLVVISHGSGGSFLGHHDTAAALADAGFVVAAISHPGDNFQDLSRQGHLSAFATRPVDLRRLIDHLLVRWSGRDRLDAERVGIFGFSRGGYTALAAAGATPNWVLRQDLCPPGSPLPLCGQIERKEWPKPPQQDSRVKAAIVVDPMTAFDADGLKSVTLPIQLWASERGGDGVTPASVAALRQALPTPPDWRVAATAGHYAFLAPCPEALARMEPAICRDDAGFDRAAFHRDFNAAVVAFFERHLAKAPPR